jgi:uncharacterized integral membrane protein
MHLWAALPGEREALRPYIDRAKSYRNDCGCAVAGICVLLTLAILIFVGRGHRSFSLQHALVDVALAIACLLVAAVAGKLVGVGLARIRLALLGRAGCVAVTSRREASDVHLQQLGHHGRD